ncbi:unnamed protein product [Cylicocyclus nassatus]|uniref:SXP/RAL-2 family protein Ani s 5-like cation-binding domain-containing protein n=1 Tax=Cylicocyclus nassatus TaxID=53992 RepID=A0AA36H0Q4_CYLNA|nr:unnamed protein product [Cylicocyclus nassatus]
MRATLLFICISSALAQSGGNGSVQVQSVGTNLAEQAKNAGSGLLAKLKDKLGDVKEKVQQGLTAIQPSQPTPAVNDSVPPVPDLENGQAQVQAPPGFIQQLQNSMSNFISNMKDAPNPFPFLNLNNPGSPAALLGNVSKEGLEDLKNMTQGVANYTMAEMKEKMTAWASKYGVKEQLDNFETERESKKTEILANAHTNVNILPSLFQQLTSIIQNETLTIPEFTKAINDYFQSLEPIQRHIVSNIIAATAMDTLLFIPRQFPGARPIESFKMFKGMNDEERRPNLFPGATKPQMMSAAEGKNAKIALPSVGNNVRKEDMTTKVQIA